MTNNEQYCDKAFTIEELQNSLIDHVPSLELNKVSSAYEMSEETCTKHSMPNGSSFFYHTTRVARILVKELEILDSSIICASLLHNAAKLSKDLDTHIIDYNFGAYVAYLVDIMNEEFFFLAKFPYDLDILVRGNAKVPKDDYLILMCSEQLDFLRTIDYDITGKHFDYIEDIVKYIFPIIEDSPNLKIQYLYKELVGEKNKILS
jgi:hypothetical protein